MKVIHENKYTFLGKCGSWYIFEAKKCKPNFAPELVLLKRARMITKDGKSRFFDPIKENHNLENLTERKPNAKLGDVSINE